MLNIAFCDDDVRYLRIIASEAKKVLEKLKVCTSIYTFKNGMDLIHTFEYQYFDVIFLDIDMPLMNGKEVARKLRTLDKNFKLVFITSFEEEVLNTFQFDVSDFLPKPMINKRLYSVLDRVVKQINDTDPQYQIFRVLRISEERIVIKIPLKDIVFFETVNRKTLLHTKRNTYLLNGYKFKDLVSKYSELGFVDIHRTCIVNIHYIFSIENTEVSLEDGTLLPMSRRKRIQVLEKFIGKICEVPHDNF